jgi:hypothetical protein
VANPTTNYGFVLPTATDLVTDLPADFDVALQGVDTRIKALQPGTTLGDLAYSSATANTNTRLGVGTNGQVLAVSGGVPAWTTTADVTPLTTKGDLFTFTTVDARLGIGANNTVLTADSAEATGMKWSAAATGGMTLLSTTSLTSASQTISGISGDYIDLLVYVINYKSVDDGGYVSFRFNADATAGRTFRRGYNATNATNLLFDSDTGVQFGGAMDNSVSSSITRLYFPLYANATTYKWADFSTLGTDSTTTTNAFYQRGMGGYNQTGALTSLNFVTTAGNLSGTVLIYGVK